MDPELIGRARRGDKDAFTTLVLALGDRLFSIAYRILRDVGRAEDAVQQAFLMAWRQLPQLRDDTRFEAWLYRLLVNACYAEVRHTRRWQPGLRLITNDTGPSIEDALVGHGVIRHVEVPAVSPSPSQRATESPASPSSSVPASASIPMLIDTDVAPDDLVAIAFLLAAPNVAIAAITVSGTGEAHCAGGVDVVLRLLERLDAPPIDVACGRDRPIAGDRAFPDAWREHADNGSDLELPTTSRQPFAGTAVELIAQTAGQTPGLRVLALGPLTNLADALGSHPELVRTIESIYAMGGALHVAGNVSFGGPPNNEVAEWNIFVDPAAAQAVVDSGLPVKLISLDGTNQVPVTPEFAERVEAEAAAPAARVLAELFAKHPFMTDGTYFLWDPLAAALAAEYPVGSFSAARVDVEEADGPEVGFTRPVEGRPNVEYLSSADPAAAENVLLEVMN